MSVSEKSCIVSGAARGIGAAIARRFAEAGAHVMLADVDETALDETVSDLLEDGLSVAAFHGDLTEKLAVANLISATIDAYERIDILVNASRALSEGDPIEAGPQLVADLFDHNVAATLRLSREVADRMIKQAEDEEDATAQIGAIVNITSTSADRTQRDLAAYSISCAALNQLTRSLAITLAPNRIRVNAIALGSVMSTWMRGMLKEDGEMRERIVAVTPLGRIGEPDEVAKAALFLASPDASFITGQILACDGGRSMLDPVDIPTY